MRRLLPLAGVLYALAAGAQTAAARDLDADCWWHISHWHCGNEIVWAPGPDESTTTTPTDTTTTTSTTSSTSTTTPSSTSTTDQPRDTTTTAIDSTTSQPTQQTAISQPSETVQAPPAPVTQPITTSSTSITQYPTTSMDSPSISPSTSSSSSRPPYPSTTATIQTTTTTTVDIPSVADMDPDTADTFFAGLDLGQLNDTTAAALIAQVQTAPPTIRASFERHVNIFGGQAEQYVPLGSLVPVKTRRIIILTVSALVALPRRRP